jgi:hypothetical protein
MACLIKLTFSFFILMENQYCTAFLIEQWKHCDFTTIWADDNQGEASILPKPVDALSWYCRIDWPIGGLLLHHR